MGRPSSTGCPFLVARRDGHLTYHRDLARAVASMVTGEVLLPWSGRTRMLTGKSAVKLSLGTRDGKAAQRWTEVHPQVDALVQMAEVRCRRHGTPARPATVPRIDPAHIRTVAE